MSKSNYQVWVQKAEDNLRWSKDNLESENYPLVCYLSQQAVELILKGYIYSKNEIPPKTHQLIRLTKVCSNLNLDLDEYLPVLAILAEYYFESRYPDEFNPELEKKEVAQKAYSSAKKVVEYVLKILSDS